jgi:hypothetical protein
MKHLMPGRVELAILLTAAVTCTLVVALSPVFDLTMAGVAVPLFLVSGLLGLRRNAKLAAIRATTRRAEIAERDGE